MKLQMYPVAVEVTEAEEVQISQPGASGPTGTVRVSVEQVPFLVELLQQAKSKIEDDRYRRKSG